MKLAMGSKFVTRLRWLVLLLPLLLGVKPSHSAPAPTDISITFIDVGQGDATLIRDGVGFDMLIDGGNKSAAGEVIKTIQSAGVDDLEVILATHADSDHIGGLIKVLESHAVKPIEFLGLDAQT